MVHSMIKIDSFDGKSVNYIVGTFNGIVLLLAHQGGNCPHSLFNPFTRASEIVPDPPWRSYAYQNFNHYGLGYGTNPDDLKIVRLKSTLGEADHSSSCDVFSIKHRSWCKPSKLTGDYDFHNNNSGTFVNGFLYWIALKKLDMNSIIVALNVKEMAFSEIHIPQKRVIRLGIFSGRLCMIIDSGLIVYIYN
ncbi:F-box domain containing protein [Tanacetum coccineum]